ncbi:ORF1102 [White spot syndrome virus]|uniref:ORF1102 n=1 Tax=White spot syndrome virus TaxID=342409 RepID=A0A2D3I6D7_9VIRU|nr:ORF1102 [White spot syndrome virus]
MLGYFSIPIIHLRRRLLVIKTATSIAAFSFPKNTELVFGSFSCTFFTDAVITIAGDWEVVFFHFCEPHLGKGP